MQLAIWLIAYRLWVIVDPLLFFRAAGSDSLAGITVTFSAMKMQEVSENALLSTEEK